MIKNNIGDVFYRLPTYLWNVRKDGGIIRVYKDGKRVTAYQLVNYKEFNKHGRYTGLINDNQTRTKILEHVL